MTIVEVSAVIIASAIVLLTLFFITGTIVFILFLRKAGKLTKKIEGTVDTLTEETKKRIEKMEAFVESIKDIKNILTYSKQIFEMVQVWKKDKKPKKEIKKESD